MSDDIRRLIRPDLLSLPPYVPIDPPDVLAGRYGLAPEQVLKLDGNENPFGPSPRAIEAVRRASDWHIYPDPDQRELRAELARWLDVDESMIVCGLGSDDLIDLLLRAVVSPGDAVVDCPPTFGMYAFSTRIAGGRATEAARRENFALDIDAVVSAGRGAKLLFLASPNNPTGNLTPAEDLERILAAGMLVAVDEAYIDFAGRDRSCLPLLRRYENLVVLRTFSKWAGLAGLRVGYGVMAPELASVLMTIKQPYNVNAAATVAAIGALEDAELLDERACKIAGARDAMAAALAEVGWLSVYPSEANFVLCR
ncbi:MAG TPA: histidinol-phosphate transaminase, partial [Candidatus Tectomicrobia bacterium]|nr:histidinol-phosphate transaminase [Candidatus Tectomicrobia bacterium]